jgi:hypothetical protein
MVRRQSSAVPGFHRAPSPAPGVPGLSMMRSALSMRANYFEQVSDL